jgi:hypothetical protein
VYSDTFDSDDILVREFRLLLKVCQPPTIQSNIKHLSR